MPCAPRCSSRTSGRTSRSTGRAGGCTCRPRRTRRRGAELAALDRGEWTAEWQQALASCAARTRALFDRGRAVCDGVTGRLRFELRATWLGGVRVLDRLEASRLRRLSRAAFARRRAICRRSPWRALWWLAGEPAHRRSTTRFSRCREPQRDAIVAVWDFCRAVDDTVDEAPAIAAVGAEADPAVVADVRARLQEWRVELDRCYRGAPATDVRAGPPAVGPAVHAAAHSRSRTSSTASRWTSIASATQSFDELLRILLARGVDRGLDLHRDLRRARRSRPRLRA